MLDLDSTQIPILRALFVDKHHINALFNFLKFVWFLGKSRDRDSIEREGGAWVESLGNMVRERIE